MQREADAISDLSADADDLDRMLETLSPADWAKPTPAPGWSIAHQVAHLAATFKMAGLAAADPDGFRMVLSKLSGNFEANVDAALNEFLGDPPEVLFDRWRAERVAAVKALAAVPTGKLVPWLVNPLPPAVLAGAGMMELFGHGQDIADALGVGRERTDRLRHLVGFAVRTWTFGYLARDLTPPAEEFRFELVGPSGQVWAFGDENAQQRVTGNAVDFCLLVTRRRHHSDLDISAVGADATQWLEIAQAYRGPAGSGRAPGQFSDAR